MKLSALFGTTVFSLGLIPGAFNGAKVAFAAPSMPPNQTKPAKPKPTNPSKPPAKPPTPKPPTAKPLPPTTQKLYSLLGVKSIFIQGNGRSTMADSLREALQDVSHHGLKSSDYWTQDVELLFQSTPIGTMEPVAPPPVVDPANPAPAPVTPPVDPKLLSFEARMIDVLVKYATHLTTGMVTPKNVGGDIRVDKEALSVEALAEVLKNSPNNLKAGLDSLSSKWPMYRRLQEAMKRMQLLAADPASFPSVKVPAKNYKINDADENIRSLKLRLQALGYPVPDTDNIYREDLIPVVLEYLLDHGLAGKGELTRDSGIWTSIGASAQSRVELIQLQLEKLRWLPTAPEDKHIFVNLAFQKIGLWENAQLVMEMKNINGRPKRATPMLRDRMPIIELNPSWTVPPRIVIMDKLESIQADPGYLRKNNFILLDRDLNPIESWGGGWNDVDLSQTDSYYLRQLPGTGNALGVLKFHLNNPYSIYLHDTNEKNLFANRGRLLSSGCIRLEKPVELAAHLLAGHKAFGTRSALEQNLATTRLADKRLPLMFRVSLPQPVPVYTVYLSAMVNDKGRILFASDAYTQDLRLKELITFGKVRTKSPADLENEELKRREEEIRDGGFEMPEEDWRDRRDRERRERDEERRRRDSCSGWWC